ncbi:MAG: hypothetical protein V1929_09895 [bacterium]
MNTKDDDKYLLEPLANSLGISLPELPEPPCDWDKLFDAQYCALPSMFERYQHNNNQPQDKQLLYSLEIQPRIQDFVLMSQIPILIRPEGPVLYLPIDALGAKDFDVEFPKWYQELLAYLNSRFSAISSGDEVYFIQYKARAHTSIPRDKQKRRDYFENQSIVDFTYIKIEKRRLLDSILWYRRLYRHCTEITEALRKCNKRRLYLTMVIWLVVGFVFCWLLGF